MRPILVLTGFVILIAAAAPRATGDGDAPTRSVTDPARHAHLKANLARFRALPADVQERVRQLDADLQQDGGVRSPLWPVMERYAGWLSRLPAEERAKIEQAPAGPERLDRVKDMLERQWHAGLPKAYLQQLANTPAGEQPALLDKWREEDRARRRERVVALRRIEEGFFDRKFRDDVQKFVKDTLEPKLNERERRNLNALPKTQPVTYYFRVLQLSEKYNLTPPGAADVWQRVRQARRMLG